MRNWIVIAIFLAFFSIHFLPPFHTIWAQEVKIEAKKVEYNLPYPGIIPDNPLYALKKIRDRVLYFLTRDYIKKAHLSLEFSDKKTSMAKLLSEKGKWQQSHKTMEEAEQDFSRIAPLLSTSEKQGVSAPDNFILTTKLSNEKHREVIEDLLGNAPEGEKKNFEVVLMLNKKNQESLTQL